MTVISFPVMGECVADDGLPTHPRWSTGHPILWGDDVVTPEGWAGFVVGMNPDEVLVTPYSDDVGGDYEEEFSPYDLRLTAYGPGHETPDLLDAVVRLTAVLDDLPATVKAERTRRGVTAAEVAQRVGYSATDFSRFENGKTTPRLPVIRGLIAWLGVDALREPASHSGRSSEPSDDDREHATNG